MTLLAAILSAFVLTGCNTAEDESTSPIQDTILHVQENEDVSFVELGQYKGLEITVPSIDITETNINELAYQIFCSYINKGHGAILNRPVEEGDLVSISFEGNIDGESFEGSSGSDYTLKISDENGFIDGFVDSIIGAIPEEPYDIELVYPEEHYDELLAGKTVHYTITVNYIIPSEMTDAVISLFESNDFSTVEELKQYAENYLNTYAQSDYDYAVRSSILDALISECTFTEMPDDMVEEYRNSLEEAIQEEASRYGWDPEVYMGYFYGSSVEDFLNTYTLSNAQETLALEAIAEKEGIILKDEELDQALQKLADNYGYESVEEFLGDYEREDYRERFLIDKVLDYLISNAVIHNTTE